MAGRLCRFFFIPLLAVSSSSSSSPPVYCNVSGCSQQCLDGRRAERGALGDVETGVDTDRPATDRPNDDSLAWGSQQAGRQRATDEGDEKVKGIRGWRRRRRVQGGRQETLTDAAAAAADDDCLYLYCTGINGAEEEAAAANTALGLVSGCAVFLENSFFCKFSLSLFSACCPLTIRPPPLHILQRCMLGAGTLELQFIWRINNRVALDPLGRHLLLLRLLVKRRRRRRRNNNKQIKRPETKKSGKWNFN